MTEDEAFAEAIERLNKAVAKLKRHTALTQMSLTNNPYRPLIRVMAKLQLIHKWPIW